MQRLSKECIFMVLVPKMSQSHVKEAGVNAGADMVDAVMGAKVADASEDEGRVNPILDDNVVLTLAA
ncbi:hypothetical protein ACOSQ4_013162 [Xanthoceras sorbifolium]